LIPRGPHRDAPAQPWAGTPRSHPIHIHFPLRYQGAHP
jgi:hypothetical protein